jgi:uncharacterized membrane protein YkvA (DUF1232 family)
MAATLRRRMALTALFRLLKPGTPGVRRRLAAIPRMIRATRRREYDGAGRLGLMLFAAIYLVSPLDFLADAIFLIVGVIGDAALVTWLFGALMDETERFLQWEARRATIGARGGQFDRSMRPG